MGGLSAAQWDGLMQLIVIMVDFIKDIPYFDFRIIFLEVKSVFTKNK